jgi:hypothetical protein
VVDIQQRRLSAFQKDLFISLSRLGKEMRGLAQNGLQPVQPTARSQPIFVSPQRLLSE